MALDTQLRPRRPDHQSLMEDEWRLVNSFEVKVVIAMLTPQQRLCLGLSWMHYSIEQIADTTGLDLDAVRRCVFTARRAFDHVVGMVSARSDRSS